MGMHVHFIYICNECGKEHGSDHNLLQLGSWEPAFFCNWKCLIKYAELKQKEKKK